MNNINNINNEHLDFIRKQYLIRLYNSSGYYDNKITNIDIVECLYSTISITNKILYDNEIYNKYFYLILNNINNINFYEFNFNYEILNDEELNYLKIFIESLNINQSGLITLKMIDDLIKNKNLLIISNKINCENNIKNNNNIKIYNFSYSSYNRGNYNNIFETIDYIEKDIIVQGLLYKINTIIIDAGVYSYLIGNKFINKYEICIL